MDKKAVKYPYISPFNYCNNSPIVYIDPDGNNPIIWQILRWLGTRGAALFFGGAAISATAQFTANYMVSQDANKAVKGIDLVDVAMAGGVNMVTGGGNSIRTLFKEGSRLAVIKGSVAVTMELVAASTDFKFENSKFESLFSGDKSNFDVVSSFVLSMSADLSADKISGILKNWAKKDLNPSIFATLSKEQKEMVKSIDKVVKSESFQTAVDSNQDIIGEYVENIIQSDVKMEIKTIQVDDLKKQNCAPQDNTSIGTGGGYGF